MNYICFLIGILILLIAGFFSYKKRCNTKKWIATITFGVLLSVFFIVLPTEWSKSENALLKPFYNIISALLYSFKVLGGRQDISQLDTINFTGIFRYIYILINYAAFIAAPVLGSSLILSFVGDSLSKIRYTFPTNRKTYVFSELNNSSLLIAKGLKSRKKKSRIVFCNTKESDESDIEEARRLHGITLYKGCDSIKINNLADKYEFCLVSKNEDSNVEIAKRLIEKFNGKSKKDINITAFAKGGPYIRLIEKISDSTNSCINIRFIDKASFFCNKLIFENPLYNTVENGKNISVMIVGCGETGMTMLKTVIWYGQIDGYELHVKVYDKDAHNIEARFLKQCPELIPDNGYDIKFIKTDICTADFEAKIKENGQDTLATVAYVFTGDDELNIEVSEYLSQIFRKSRDFKETPPVFTWVNDTVKFNLFYKNNNTYLRERNIRLVGDVERLFTDKTFFNSQLENLALAVYLCYDGQLHNDPSHTMYKESVRNFKNREYNRRSSMAAAIHITAKLHAHGILKKNEAELTNEKAHLFKNYINKNPDKIEVLARNEHLRWTAFMRSEGYMSTSLESARLYAGYKNSHKDDLSKLHLCLTDSDNLPLIENYCRDELNYAKKDYSFRKYDEDIVKSIPEIIILANKLTQEEQ